jgi:similar to stage IV sporulation protein
LYNRIDFKTRIRTIEGSEILRAHNFFNGYLKISVKGFSVERFLNLVTYNKIYVWDLKRDKSGIVLKISIKAFKLLKPYARKTGCKIKILNKFGLPFKIYKYRKRKVFFIGVILFISILCVLSSFVWDIDVIGNSRVNSQDIIKFCEQKSFKVGKPKFLIDDKKIEKEILNNFLDINWVNVKIRGTQAFINIRETIEKNKTINSYEPCDIIAKKNGIITDMNVFSGTPKVKINDVVKKNDVIVSSEVVILNNNQSSCEPSFELKHANAEVQAKTFYNIDFFVSNYYKIKKYTGKKKKNYVVNFFNHRINLIKKIKFKNYDKKITKKKIKLIKNFILPIEIYIIDNKEFLLINKNRSPEETKILANKLVDKKIKNRDLISKNIELIKKTNGYLVKTEIILKERIDTIKYRN